MSEIKRVEEIEIEIIMNKEQAKLLTEDIKSTTSALYILLKQAHDEKAWVALGYSTWADYIEQEFDFSRARSYQLINQANVIEEINHASGIPLHITEREARSIKNRLPEITEKLTKEVKEAGLEPSEASMKAQGIIDQARYDEDEEKRQRDHAKSLKEDDGEEVDTGRSDYEAKEDVEWTPSNDAYGEDLSKDDEFFLENLMMTLSIFDSMPEASEFGRRIKESSQSTHKLKKAAQEGYASITKLLDEIE